MRITYVVVLDCLHSTIFNPPIPKVSELVWCRNCKKYKRVKIRKPEFRIRCVSCRYGKGFGQARVNAEMSACRHRRNKPSHTVEIWEGGKLFLKLGPDHEQLTIANAEPPPF